jgi:DHA3 family macrolide efflux protein-like MFS transporter
MFGILCQRNFCFLWIAGLVSTLGDWILAASLPFYVYLQSGSVLATGTIFLLEAIPQLAFGYLAGVCTDRWDRKKTMIVADGSRALLLLSLLLIRFPGYFWIIYPVAFIETTISLFFGPAQGSLLPDIVGKQNVMQANSLGSISENACRLGGPALGGLLLAFFGLNSVVFVDIASYLVSGVLILCIVLPAAIRVNDSASSALKAALSLSSIWGDLRTGLTFLYTQRWLTVVCTVMGIAMFGQGILNVLLVAFVEQVLHGNAQEFGWILSAQGIGGIVGGALIGYWAKKLSPYLLLAWSLSCAGILLLLIINLPMYLLALILFAMIGIPAVGWIVSASTLLQNNVDRFYRGRILGAFGTITTTSILCGMAMASLLGDVLGITFVLNIAGVFIAFAGVLTFFFHKGYTVQVESQKEEYGDFEKRHDTPMVSLD